MPGTIAQIPHARHPTPTSAVRGPGVSAPSRLVLLTARERANHLTRTERQIEAVSYDINSPTGFATHTEQAWSGDFGIAILRVEVPGSSSSTRSSRRSRRSRIPRPA
jgi:hypothetical protein